MENEPGLESRRGANRSAGAPDGHWEGPRSGSAFTCTGVCEEPAVFWDADSVPAPLWVGEVFISADEARDRDCALGCVADDLRGIFNVANEDDLRWFVDEDGTEVRAEPLTGLELEVDTVVTFLTTVLLELVSLVLAFFLDEVDALALEACIAFVADILRSGWSSSESLSDSVSARFRLVAFLASLMTEEAGTSPFLSLVSEDGLMRLMNICIVFVTLPFALTSTCFDRTSSRILEMAEES